MTTLNHSELCAVTGGKNPWDVVKDVAKKVVKVQAASLSPGLVEIPKAVSAVYQWGYRDGKAC